MKKNDITALRESLLDTIEKVKSGEMDTAKAKAVADIGQVIVNTAKAETDFLKVVGNRRANREGKKAIKSNQTGIAIEKGEELKIETPEKAREATKEESEWRELKSWAATNFGSRFVCEDFEGDSTFPCTVEGWCKMPDGKPLVIVYDQNNISGISDVDIQIQFKDVSFRSTPQRKHLVAVSKESLKKA